MTLSKFAQSFYSQHGEDGIIAEIVRRIEPPPRCLEFGAWDGVKFSNTRLLAEAGWHAVFVESDEQRYRELVDNCRALPRPRPIHHRLAIDGFDGVEAVIARDPLLSDGFMDNCGLVSIDVDGADWHVWEAMESRPAIVVIEVNPTVPKDVEFVQARSTDVHHGASMLSTVRLGERKEYFLAAATECNAVFVRGDLKTRLGDVGDPFAEWRPAQDGRIFQGYDGTVFVVGMDRLLWLDLPVTSDDFQILPKSARKWRP